MNSFNVEANFYADISNSCDLVPFNFGGHVPGHSGFSFHYLPVPKAGDYLEFG
jgi:hypothetical protein